LGVFIETQCIMEHKKNLCIWVTLLECECYAGCSRIETENIEVGRTTSR